MTGRIEEIVRDVLGCWPEDEKLPFVYHMLAQ